MDYSNYEAEDFMLDGSFRNYCTGNNEEDIQFWENWVHDNPGKKEMICEAKELLLALTGGHTTEQLTADKNRFENAFQQHISQTPVTILPRELPVPARRFGKKIFAYAAASAAAVAILFFVFSPPKKHDTQNEQAALQYNFKEISKAGERKSFQLPDGSKVMLNAGSSIDISRSFNMHNREITLTGEAFFDVAHNAEKPFIIHTTNMDVKVLGTVFNVKAYPGDKLSETSLIKGSVEVTIRNNSNKKVLLKPHQKIVLPNTPEKETIRSTDNKNSTAPAAPDFKIKALTYYKTDSTLAEVSWTENRLVFTDNTFEDIAAELQRWYNISIVFTDNQVKQFRYTAVFDQKNVIQVLNALQLSRRFEYKIEENNKIAIGR
ncbi:MAG: FecR domain-containing protein [Chitinophagaceae bacterium]|nr:FecR domain-containing protein [Chitinophagaceae bacterium]